MSYSAYDDSDFAGLPEVKYKEIPLLKRMISKVSLDMAVSPEVIRNIEHQNALNMIAKKYPFVGLDCVHWSTEHTKLHEITLYYLKVALP
jgi:hypothetical protein